MVVSAHDLDLIDLHSVITRAPLTVPPGADVASVITQMHTQDSCAVVVEAGRVIGILTDHDVTRLVAQQQDLSQRVCEVMAEPSPICVSDLTANGTIPEPLIHHPAGHRPVVNREGNLIGLTRRDVLWTDLLKQERSERSSDLASFPVASDVHKAIRPQSRWQLALESTGDGLWDWNIQTYEVYFSSQWKAMLGYGEAEIGSIFDEWQRLVHPDDRPRCYAAVLRVLNAEQPTYQIEHRLRCRDGSYKWILSRGKIIDWTAEGEPLRMLGTHTDISARKRVELTLQHLIEGTAATTGCDFFPTLVQYVAEALAVSHAFIAKIENRQMQVLAYWVHGSWQPTFTCELPYPCRGTKLPRHHQCSAASESEIHSTLHQVWPRRLPDYSLSVALQDQNRNVIGYLFILDDNSIQDPRGAEAILNVFAARVTAELERQAAFVSLKALNQTLEEKVKTRTEELAQQKQLLQKMLDTVPFSVYWKDQNLGYLSGNRNFLQDVGLSDLEELVGKTDYDLPWGSSEAEGVREDDRKVIRSNQARLGDTRQLSHSDRLIWIEQNKLPIHDQEGNVTGLLGTYQDITQRMQAETDRQCMIQELSAYKQAIDRFASVAVTDTNGIITYVNDRFCDVSGYKREELLGQTHRLIKSDCHSLSFYRDLWYTISNGDIWRGELCNRSKKGILYWEESSIVPFLNEKGRPVQYLAIRFDITNRKKAELELQKGKRFIQQIAESSPNILYLYNLKVDCNVYTNRNIMSVLGYTSTQGQTSSTTLLENLMHPDDQVRYREHRQRLEVLCDGDTVEFEYRIQHANGEWRWFCRRDAVFSRDADGQVEQIIGTAQDITDRKHAQAQLQRSNEELARATRLKDEFLANMSHELRTPLNAILGLTEGLQEGVFGCLQERQSKALSTIERSGTHLLELINDILDVAKIEAGHVKLECAPTSVEHLCLSSLTFVKQQAQKKRIQLTTQMSPSLPNLYIDERRMRQVLINLLNNAVKFTPRDGSIRLEALCHKGRLGSQDPESPVQYLLRLAVYDTGIGIAQENLDKLFLPFVQIDSALNRQYTGTGLGLALVQQIVKLHGGQVRVTSELGVGSCFAIDIPCEVCSYGPAFVPLPESEQDLESTPTILLVEDNEANIMTISAYLDAKGYNITLARSGSDAIMQAEAQPPDLVLMDIQMPGMDGIETIQRIRQIPSLQTIPIIALTALAMPGDRDRCLAIGANDYLSKPVKLKELANTIQRLWSLQSASVSKIT